MDTNVLAAVFYHKLDICLRYEAVGRDGVYRAYHAQSYATLFPEVGDKFKQLYRHTVSGRCPVYVFPDVLFQKI